MSDLFGPKMQLTRLLTASLTQSNPKDVRFFFPRTSSELWANSAVLANASPYFKTILAAGLSESDITTSVSNNGERKASQRASNDDFADSHDETDTQHPPAKVDEASDAPHKFHEVVITSSAHTTCAALLAYIYTSHLAFAPLRSSTTPRPDISTPPFPQPTSTKSLYQLSHFLSIF